LHSDGLATPVVFCVFNRPVPTRTVFDAIARARPVKLLIVADGPRKDRPGDAGLCQTVREIVQQVNWPCEVLTNFAEDNLGCRVRIISGLNWAFTLVDEAIILEDDCLPDPSFFPFCEELLERYRGDSRIAMISGDKFSPQPLRTAYSYYFSQMTHIWGWATWKSAWARYDRHLQRWPELKAANMLSEVFDDPVMARYWTDRFDEMHNDTGPNTWDYQWMYTNLIHNALSITPRVNMVTNIGFGPDSTHTAQANKAWVLPACPLNSPLHHPPSILPMRSLDRSYHMMFLPRGKFSRAVRSVGRLGRRIF
jgi:hypothetical protein